MNRFLQRNRGAIQVQEEMVEPSYVMLGEELSEEELLREVRRFRAVHGGVKIFLCDSGGMRLPLQKTGSR